MGGNPAYPAEGGLLLWQRTQVHGNRERWRVVFNLHEEIDGPIGVEVYRDPDSGLRRRFLAYGKQITVGPPGLERHEESNLSINGMYPEFGDIDGDGHLDILLKEGDEGSGGGGIYRLLLTRRGGVEEVVRRQVSDEYMEIRAGQLRIGRAVYEKGDSHCCPTFTRRIVKQWNGVEMVTIGDRLIRNEY